VTIETTVAASNSNESEPVIETVIEEEHSDEVEIARIEAERDITITALHSDVERERIELEAEQTNERHREIEICREEIARLTGIVESLTEQVTSLIPPLPLVEETRMEELETALEPDLIQPSTQAPIAEIKTELSEESAEENPVAETPSRARRFIAI